MNEIFLLEGAVKDTSGSTPSRPNRFSKPGYSIKLCHRSGASNKMCDYRSRFPASSSSEEDLVATLVAELETDTEDQDLAPSENPEEEIDHRPVSQEEIREEQRKVPEYKKIIDALDSNIPEAITQYELGDDTLRLKAESEAEEGHLIIPYALRQRIIEQVHTSPLMNAHLRSEKTFEKLKRRIYWEAMKTDVRKVVTSCEICQKRKISTQQKHHEPMQKPDAQTRNYTWTYSDPSRHPEATILHSIPEELISDSGVQFTSALWEELVQLIGTKHIRTTPYHPNSNDNCERINLPLMDMIASTARKSPEEWDKQLKFITLALHTSVHRVTKETPFFLVAIDILVAIDAFSKIIQKLPVWFFRTCKGTTQPALIWIKRRKRGTAGCTKENPSIGGQIARGRGTSEESGGSEYPPPEAPNPEDDRGAPQEPIVAQM
ncbi:hypothetical protein QR680_007931 [Steinernema hermaphroditum]|uniref:RNA-directed DNA polymerase n=1 Tax=Steinernema hermaphroditum TaxID=289476 RepID=A0AA39IH44_9BILA|nr:hypothetical protein QR680_007931 [Steinernema hermaphroditum]